MGPGRRAFSLPWMGHQVIGPKDVPQPPLLASAQHRRGHSPHYSLCQIGHRTSPGWLSSHTVSPAGRGVSRSNWNPRGHNLPGSANFTPQGLEIIPEGPCSACAEKHLSQPSASSLQAHPILPEVRLLQGLLLILGHTVSFTLTLTGFRALRSSTWSKIKVGRLGSGSCFLL